MSETSKPTVVQAQRPTTCPDCSYYIRPGDPVVAGHMPDQWRHVTCPQFLAGGRA